MRLVSIDLDGTLIGSDLTISDADREAIARATASGVHVVLATGRMFAASKPYADSLGLTGPLACLQGGAIYDLRSGSLLHATPLGAPLALMAYDLLLAKGYHLQVYFGDTLYLDHSSARSDEYMRLSRVQPVMVPDLRALLSGAPPPGALIKLLGMGPPEAVAADVPVVSVQLGAAANVCRSLPEYLEVTDREANKGQALIRMACVLGVDLAETAAVGDSDNDVPMFAAASVSFAVAGATPAARNAATRVVGRRGQGVAEALTLVCRSDVRGRT